jgi:hypothetical protein
LHCHPASPHAPVTALDVHSCALADGGVRLRYQLEAEMRALCMPAPLPHAGFADELWQHTCFEAFIGTTGLSAYREFNFSPSGQWAAYAFTDYRKRDASWLPDATPSIHMRSTQEGFDLEVTIPAALLPVSATASGTLHIGLNAVIETTGGSLSYWALSHPAERPDFHLRTAFTLRLAPHTDLP